MPTLVFVYNADAGLGSRLLDSAHKLVSPQTYACNLCKLSHGLMGERTAWRRFIERLPYPAEFLHRDQAEQRFGDTLEPMTWPAILYHDDHGTRVWLDAETLNTLDTPEALMQRIERHLTLDGAKLREVPA